MKPTTAIFGAAAAVALVGLVHLDTRIPDIPNVTTPKPVAPRASAEVKPATVVVSKESPFAQGPFWR